ncbi:hypothetical protein QBC38DRAFT_520622 [Podospora fimiseda]|uniref:SsuA/THI5-like domain-containing protein n=1 Tax=Podospora fimiseda TaxID=252190 RepID=A0AAN7BFE6_9PEZI|nr:hypothetical protein QBC38DRAFT_520622 [Podospora fimiseda]
MHIKQVHLLGGLFLTVPTLAALKIAAALNVIEYAPLLVTNQDYFNNTATIINGGVASIVSDTSVDLAANAETQALRQYRNNPSLRVIWNVAQVPYRIVANKKSKISTLSDLKGKKIGTIQGTSAGYFIEHYLLTAANLKPSDYKIISGSDCRASPCGSNTFPSMLSKGTIDAIGFWEPTIEVAIQTLGEQNVVVFQNRTAYREIYNLHSTAEKLRDPKKRKEIVQFLRQLIKAQKIFDEDPTKVYSRVSKAVNVGVPLLQKVWPVHDWKGGIPGDLLDVLEEEDKYVAKVDNRAAASRDKLKNLIDPTVLEEALKEGF